MAKASGYDYTEHARLHCNSYEAQQEISIQMYYAAMATCKQN